jgi:outer membrane protein assembly factor BamD
MIHATRRCFVVFLFALALSGCASIVDPTKDWTAEQFYQAAKSYLDDGHYEEAIKLYEQLQGRYPYGRYAEQAQLETAYAYYKYDEPALAVAACDRFIRQYPTHAHVDYAYYLKGLVNFRDKRSFGNWLFGSGDELLDRDPRATRESFQAFKELVDRFPNSRYAEDARQRMTYLFEAQARYEVTVAEYYYQRRAYVAAANRAKYALENYPRTPATEDALGIQALAYKRMGLQKLHEDTVKVLARNFPNSRYLKEIEVTAPG